LLLLLLLLKSRLEVLTPSFNLEADELNSI